MKKNKIASLGAVMAAAMMLTVAPSQAQALTFDTTPTALILQVQASVEAGDMNSALALIARLKQMGVTSITVGNQVLTVAALEQMVVTGSPQVLAVLAAFAAAPPAITAFGFQPVSVASVAPVGDTFPTSSAG